MGSRENRRRRWLERVERRAYDVGQRDAYDACLESGSSDTPRGGWDSWAIEGAGRRCLLAECGVRTPCPAEAFDAACRGYHAGGLQGAREAEAA